jgi:hypothetical protein
MDFKRLKSGMAEIVTIAETVPDPFRERCFDLLLNALLNDGDAGPKTPPPPERASPTPQDPHC